MLALTVWVFFFLMAVVIHEVCHGLVANYLGDPTARLAGRLTLNPLKHIDPFWTILFPAFLFISTGGRFAVGMAKPVPVDFNRLRNPKQDMIWVALAGPAANMVLAVLLAWAYRMYGAPVSLAGFPGESPVATFLLFAVYFNLGLAAFNLIPIPPLDGSRILTGILPRPWAYRYLQIEPFGFLIVILLYMSGVFSYVVFPVINGMCRVLNVPPIPVSF